MTAPPADRRAIARALLSVSDKTGLVGLARALAARNVVLVSTGGTAAALREAGLAVTDVAAVTGLPEMLEGRVKTLHPRIHGGLLARRDHAEDLATLEHHAIPPVDLLVVNLYPFEATRAAGASAADCIEMIDIGGPAMIRAGAKNHAFVTVVTDVQDYPALLAELDAHDGATTLPFRQMMAATAFARTGLAHWLG
jgi:phosphoribosylaminoimidazolecarboxamide formyltransferase/IMP cyclohydrolase